MDARKYLKAGGFIKKQDLKREGPRVLTIAAVEECEGFANKNGEPAAMEFQLVFDDDSRFSLRAATNLRRMVSFFGHDTDAWVGQTIEVYFSPDVPNPRGGEPGGIRLQLPAKRPAPARFVSDLEAGDDTAGDVPFGVES